ncbi:MAG: transglutaminase domain-containing protein [Patescibacteria group bacterium]
MPTRERLTTEQQDSHSEKRMSAEQLREYLEWKRTVPLAIRSLVEGKLLGKMVRLDQSDLPSILEFYQAFRQTLRDPHVGVDTLEVSEVIRRQIKALQQMKIGEDQVNIIAALADSEIGFDVKANYVRSKLLPRLEFLRSRDRQLVDEASKKSDETNVTGEQQEEEYTPHRTETQESEGLPSEAVATVAPFFGGNYTDSVFDQFDAGTLTWRKSVRKRSEIPEQTLDQNRKRAYRSTVKNGTAVVKLPDGWGADRESVKWLSSEPEAWSLVHDQDSIVRLTVNGEDGQSYPFQIEIAPAADAIDFSPPEGEFPPVPEHFPEELLAFATKLKAERLPHGVKVRRLASFIRKHLEYDMDPQWDAVYKADPNRYFEEIWKNKKAKCDEANTLLVRLLTKVGVYAKFLGGHSVRAKSPAGEAMLLESNRHARAAAWDPSEKKWIRLDATPAGDPNVDQEEQEADLGEGDYGEQEAEIMSDEELQKRLAKAEKEEQAKDERENPELAYAKEAGCSPEEARAVLKKIAELRIKHASVLRDADRQWQTLVRENTRERIVDRGPVRMSEMDDIDPDELVSGAIEIKAGEKDPLIGMREDVEKIKEKWFGGYEVYIAADMSESMDQTIGGVKKVDAQRDMVYLLVDSCMTAAVTTKQQERQLKAPMPVKVSVSVFGKLTQIALPLTGTWGPKEQIILYRALNVVAGGTTPDHLALTQINKQIVESTKEEEAARQKKQALKKQGWGMRRFVIATADGGSDNPASVKKANKKLTDAGIPVDLFLISPEGDVNLRQAAEDAYGSVTPISDVNDLAKKGLARLTERIKEAYGKK